MSQHRNPRALLTPAMHSVLDRMARAGHLPLHALSPQQARSHYDKGAGVLELAQAFAVADAPASVTAIPASLASATD